ncbi:glycosyl-transferase for dystroglycan-domain-containing protein [Pilobolus umbonatus]|nr:glycosyl-transferase for dystroglycan-domain-containing protein [Pilobolus umbonatus]
MTVDIQYFMLRKGLKFTLGFIMLFIVTYYYLQSSSRLRSANLRKALLAGNDSVVANGRFNCHFAWTDGNGGMHQLPIETVLSKSFSLSSYSEQSQIIPYYYKSQWNSPGEDITIVTLITRNRIPNLARLAAQYNGPISATIHISDDEEGEFTLDLLEQAMEQNSAMRKYVDIHIVRDEFDRELNLWRNVAKLFARSEYVMMLDIDFFPCTQFRESVLNNVHAMNLLRSGDAALVIPAFEFSQQEDGLDYRTFPRNKRDLIQLYNENKIESFHSFWLPGHAPTDYERWVNIPSTAAYPDESADEIYPVNEYQHSYEPYVIYKNQGSPWCDERFAGYGSNKAACLFELYVSGVDFYVLPDDFIIHQTHVYPDEVRSIEVKIIYCISFIN